MELSLLELLATGLGTCVVLMAAVWWVAGRLDNYGVVDVAWTAEVGLLAVLYAVLAEAPPARAWLVAITGAVWSLRLGVYLFRRVMALHPVEDTRYQDLRKAWSPRVHARMFGFFQIQALAAAFFSLPFALTLGNPSGDLDGVELAGASLWVVGVMGESFADWQLAAFKADPATRGQICRRGLWGWSRHPNYFFEWVVWCGFALMALPAPHGWLALACPVGMLWLLLRVTGIPALEAAALSRRGDAYREYQRTTSAFVPWFPSR